MISLPRAEDILSAPRGRRLCWSLLDILLDAQGDLGEQAWTRVSHDVWRGAYQDRLPGLAAELSVRVGASGVAQIAESTDELRLLAALVETVDRAAYWQPPDDVDQALADAAVRETLLPLAQAVIAAPAAQWWTSPAALDRQQYVEWTDQHGVALQVSGIAEKLTYWRAKHAQWDTWWSTPRPSSIATTTRAIAGLGAVGLCLVEDGFGCEQAICWPVGPSRPARVYEITAPEHWQNLAGRFPLDVTKARRESWRYLSNWDGTWLIPDFGAVAADYDAIHLSATGYLLTAGRALPVESARTLLAGWNPDETYWLTDVLAVSGKPRTWNLRRQPIRWEPDET
jgi:hypothetical protein